ncbi:hypothetical protein [Pseudonocardia parietis]|uniref:Uncharacterized protein n=1 Tax=Pseudonocardia parietis TaxID=570936 RepID=A0ABS4VVR3_9PSEU|nr:hypothetical protein [Pseudonocardia parietis]MBP2368011.1 hypothetical protein [Pseudonocardia parietis]
MREDDDAGSGAFVLGGALVAVLLAGAALLLAVSPAPAGGAPARVERAGVSSGCAGGSDAAILFGLVCEDGG